jgi:hypothetical protein
MPTPAARIVHGNLPNDVSLIDEPDMLVQSLTVTPSREKKEYKGANGAVQGIEYKNPLITLAFNAFISDRVNLCDQHPGTTVASLANFSAARFGFDPSDGIMVFEDPSTTQNLEDPETITFSVVQYPFVTA